MKTTLDLPDALVKEVKLRAVHQGKKLKDVVADLLRKGLSAEESEGKLETPILARDKDTGLLVIQGGRTANVTPDELADILNSQEAEWHGAPRR